MERNSEIFETMQKENKETFTSYQRKKKKENSHLDQKHMLLSNRGIIIEFLSVQSSVLQLFFFWCSIMHVV